MSGLRVLDNGATQPLVDVAFDDVGAPPWPHQPTVEWQVVGQCNYDCSYCIQSKKHRVGITADDDLHRAIDFLAALPVEKSRRR